MLGLRCLHYIAQNYKETAKAILADQDRDRVQGPSGFPLALAAISVADALVRLLEAHPLTANAVFGLRSAGSGEPMGAFLELFGLVFTSFARHHHDAIEAFIALGGAPQLAVMQYNSIHSGFFAGLGQRGNLAREWKTGGHATAIAAQYRSHHGRPDSHISHFASCPLMTPC